MTKRRLLVVGDKVRVRKQGADKQFNDDFVSKIGTVKEIDYNECGASLHDPMYTVAVRFVGTDAFWGEELRRLPKSKAYTQHTGSPSRKRIVRTKTFYCETCLDYVEVERLDGDWNKDFMCMDCHDTLTSA